MSILDKLLKKYLRLNLGQRLSLYLVAICTGFLLLAIVVFFPMYMEHERHKLHEQIVVSLDSINELLADQLRHGNRQSVQALLASVPSPYLSGMQLRTKDDEIYEVGSVLSGHSSVRKVLAADGEFVGEIELAFNESYYQSVAMRQVGKLFGLAFILLVFVGLVFNYVVRKVVTTHLRRISHFSSCELPKNKDFKPFALKRLPFDDELADLVKVFNASKKKNIDHAIARESYEYQLELQANYDVLTHLPNRHHADMHFIRTLNKMKESVDKNTLAVLFIDLDGFKEINDTLGHHVGDLILKQSAGRFDEVSRIFNAYVARFGGDEFVASLVCAKDDTAYELAKNIIDSLKENFVIDNNHLKLSCSVGLVFSTPDVLDPEELIRKADIAMYQAKESGRNRYAVFNESMRKNIINLTSIKNKLRAAMVNEEFTIYYQPLVDLKARKIIGFEALIRWQDEELGFIPPETFIPVAEKAGMVCALDTWVFSKAVEQVRAWRELCGEDFIVSVNFSPTNFVHKGLSEWLDSHSVFADRLSWVEVEVTERLMLDNNDAVMRMLEKMMSMGITFSIDDFGTGYSSLGYIKKFNHVLSKIKIDRMFVGELLHDDAGQALVRSIVTMAESLSIEVLAEGVETREQEEVLIQLGCDFAQGYYYSKPHPSEVIEEMLKDQAQLYSIIENKPPNISMQANTINPTSK